LRNYRPRVARDLDERLFLARRQAPLPVALVPSSGNIIAVESSPGKWRFRREYRNKDVGGFGHSELIFLEKCGDVEIRYGIGQCREIDFFLLPKDIYGIPI
jgi:hypothetical protein